jgi:hypothetical protein
MKPVHCSAEIRIGGHGKFDIDPRRRCGATAADVAAADAGDRRDGRTGTVTSAAAATTASVAARIASSLP